MCRGPFAAEQASKSELIRVIERATDAGLAGRMVVLLADGAGLNARSGWHVTALSAALRLRRYDVVRMLVGPARGRQRAGASFIWRSCYKPPRTCRHCCQGTSHRELMKLHLNWPAIWARSTKRAWCWPQQRQPTV